MSRLQPQPALMVEMVERRNSNVARIDPALVSAAARGDEMARAQLVEQTLPFVHRMVVRLIGRTRDSDDLIQNVYVHALQSLGGFRGESSFTTWLGAICVNVARHHWRQHRSGEVVDLQLIASGERDSEERVIARETLRDALAVIHSLSPKIRAAFVLHVLEEIDIPTVAAMTSTSVEATYKAVQRAKAHIEERATKQPNLACFTGKARQGRS